NRACSIRTRSTTEAFEGRGGVRGRLARVGREGGYCEGCGDYRGQAMADRCHSSPECQRRTSWTSLRALLGAELLSTKSWELQLGYLTPTGAAECLSSFGILRRPA